MAPLALPARRGLSPVRQSCESQNALKITRPHYDRRVHTRTAFTKRYEEGHFAKVCTFQAKTEGFPRVFEKRSETMIRRVSLRRTHGLAPPASLLGARGPRRGRLAARPGRACGPHSAPLHSRWRGFADGWVCRAATEAGQLSGSVGAPAAGPKEAPDDQGLVRDDAQAAASIRFGAVGHGAAREAAFARLPSRWPYGRRCF